MAAHFKRHLSDLAFRGLRLAFRALPLTEAARDRVRRHFMDRFPSIVPIDPRGHAPVARPPHRALLSADLPAIGFRAPVPGRLPDPLPATVVAFYLPQFHPIPENDAWWGRGFTEWRNVARALPQFEGHAQPRLPRDLGFYDLRNADSMRAQVALAHAHGIGAFCFYFYWFQGRTLLEAPLEHWLRDESITLPACVCWANESWSRRWDGRSGDFLIEQSHDADDDLAFIAHVARYLRDPRYLCVDGKPLLLVYRPELMPDPAATATRWRGWCRKHGLGEIIIACVQGFERQDPRDMGFDAAVEFPPNLSTPANITARQRLVNPHYAGQVLDWRDVAAEYQARPMPPYRCFPGVNPGWDNEPRRQGQGRSYLHASPRRFRDWLQHTVETRLAGKPDADRLVFVNAWNEWAEGALLEPDARLGHAWLQATRSALWRAVAGRVPPPGRPCIIVHAWDAGAFDEILSTLEACDLAFRLVVTTNDERAARMQALLDARRIDAELLVGENRGRDVLPFLQIADRLLDEGEDVVLKLHTKQSTHRHDGIAWRRDLIARLLAPGRDRSIFMVMSQDRSLGMVAPEGHIQPLSNHWKANAERVEALTTRLGIPAPCVESDTFVAGTMFWVRLEALRPLLDANLDEWEFEREEGQLDGTFAHAVERIFALCVLAGGHRVVDAATLAGGTAPAPGAYRFAARN